MSEHRYLHFSIQGEYVTKVTREMCHDKGKLAEAVDLLKSSLVCDQLTDREVEQICYDILNGRARLVGIYPGDYHLEYIKGAENANDISTTMRRLMDELEQRQQEIQSLQRRYLFMCDHIPSYTLERALKAYYNEGYVQDDPKFFERMVHCDEMPGYDEYNTALSELIEDLGLDNPEPDYGTVLVSTDPMSPAARVAKFASNPTQALNEVMTRMHKEYKIADYGWLEPNGTYHPIEWGAHAKWAADYLDEHYPFIPGPDGCYAELYYRNGPNGEREYINNGDVLVYSLGWILIDNPTQGLGRHTCRPDKPMTKAQKEFLFDYYTERGMRKEANALYEDDDF